MTHIKSYSTVFRISYFTKHTEATSCPFPPINRSCKRSPSGRKHEQTDFCTVEMPIEAFLLENKSEPSSSVKTIRSALFSSHLFCNLGRKSDDYPREATDFGFI
ncbi:hypothetical protein CDAR_262431 [Caerostris darwini]|uniref:Uncharacterized protein n=1 Tax=Caerostris darwini TaxID=1538125 RepID=A0AAV4X0B3_9ARAC|nr:hypothetical protein CDAR_262431 [Caerostris darwini]